MGYPWGISVRAVRPRPRPRPKKWSLDHAGLETLTSLYPADLQRYGDLREKADDQVLNNALHVLRFTISY